jgi:hypothetical protein
MSGSEASADRFLATKPAHPQESTTSAADGPKVATTMQKTWFASHRSGLILERPATAIVDCI